MLKISLALNMLCNATIVKTNMPLYGGPLRKNVIQILVLSTILSLLILKLSSMQRVAFRITK